MLKICILDAQTLGKDVNISKFEDYGQLSVYADTKPEQVIDRIKDQDIIITNKVILNRDNLKYVPGVKLICITATGTNNIDLEYAKRNHIPVTNVAGYSTVSVAQHTFAMLFYLLEHLHYYDNYVKSGQYERSGMFTHLDKPFYEINGKTWGIIGLGTIGNSVADLAKAFGCNVVYYSTSGRNNSSKYERKELDELLGISDVVSVHCPLNKNTRNLINYDKLKLMKTNCILLNVGRGGIVVEQDLARALDESIIAGAGLDVLENEPVEAGNPLLKINNTDRLIITPHIAWASLEARNRVVDEVALNIEAFINGQERNRV